MGQRSKGIKAKVPRNKNTYGRLTLPDFTASPKLQCSRLWCWQDSPTDHETERVQMNSHARSLSTHKSKVDPASHRIQRNLK